MSKVTVTISIGRNVGSKPMAAPKWGDFRHAVARDLRGASADVHVADAKSSGEWNGIAEESRTWVAVVDSSALKAVRSNLADAARRFDQDAIALTTGQTELVTRTSNVDPEACRRWTHCTNDCCGPCPGCGNRPGARAGWL